MMQQGPPIPPPREILTSGPLVTRVWWRFFQYLGGITGNGQASMNLVEVGDLAALNVPSSAGRIAALESRIGYLEQYILNQPNTAGRVAELAGEVASLRSYVFDGLRPISDTTQLQRDVDILLAATLGTH